MTASLFVGIIVVLVVLFWIYRSTQRESHHLDDLHINSREGGGS